MNSLKFSLCLPILALATVVSGYNPSHYGCCLSDRDAAGILARYTKFFLNLDASTIKWLADDTFADDFVQYDETYITSPVPQGTDYRRITSKADLIKQTTTDVTVSGKILAQRRFRLVHMIHDCDSLAFRWEFDYTIGQDNFAGVPLNQTRAPVGKKVQHKSMEMIKVDCRSKLVKVGWVSQDWWNLIRNLGFEDYANFV